MRYQDGWSFWQNWFKQQYINCQNMGDCISQQKKPKIQPKTDVANNPQHYKQNNLKPILKPRLPSQIILPPSNPLFKDKIVPCKQETIALKVPKDLKTWAEFHWISQQKYLIPNQLIKQPSSFIRNRSFQEKYLWFKNNLQKLRIPFTSGKSDQLNVDRSNLLMSSNSQFKQINFHKEVKINFNDDDQAMDAGGLLREWMNLCIHQVFSKDLGILSLCDTSTTFYKFNFNEYVKDLFQVAAKILGIVIGKAIFQRIPLKCFLNYTILRQICSQPIQMNDIYTFDIDFYRGWKFMIENNMITSLEQNFCVYQFDQHGTQITVPLKENGFHIKVTTTNREEYIQLLMKHYCTGSIIKMIQNIRFGIYQVIPHDLLSVFQPHQLDMIINGKSQIDLKDLKENVVYTDYSLLDQVIIWFWEYLENLPQEKLQHALHFVTGNSRVPIQGFKYLESNRGEYQKFQIRQVPYDPIEPYPKSHTCFNRLQLPLYPNREQFDKNIIYISVENNHFGLE